MDGLDLKVPTILRGFQQSMVGLTLTQLTPAPMQHHHNGLISEMKITNKQTNGKNNFNKLVIDSQVIFLFAGENLFVNLVPMALIPC